MKEKEIRDYQQSPVMEDKVRVVKHDGDTEIVMYEKFDYPKYQQSLGRVSDWSLNALLAAGINPDFGIHTGNPTRIEGLDYIDAMIAQADEILAGAEEEANNKF